jgi:hypothetical protein
MSEDLKVCFGFVYLFICLGLISLFLDYFLQREARRQFYRDLVRLVLLYEQSDLLECSIQMPKILGSRIVRFAAYEAVLKDLSNVYHSGITDYHSMLAYVLSLHKSYCYSNRDLIKFKNKLLKEKTQK